MKFDPEQILFPRSDNFTNIVTLDLYVTFCVGYFPSGEHKLKFSPYNFCVMMENGLKTLNTLNDTTAGMCSLRFIDTVSFYILYSLIQNNGLTP